MRFSPRILLGILLGLVGIALIAAAEAFDWGEFGRDGQATLARQAKVTADQARRATYTLADFFAIWRATYHTGYGTGHTIVLEYAGNSGE